MMRWQARVLWSRRLGASLTLLVATLGCGSETPLATIRAKSGSVERDFAAQPSHWTAADIGSTFALGDGVQTLRDGSAQLALDDGSQLAMQRDTRIRFSPVAPGPKRMAFDVEAGAASLEAGDAPVSLRTSVGLARIEPRTRVSLQPSSAGLRFTVEVGRAVFGPSESLESGEGVMVEPDGSTELLGRGPAPLATPAAMIEPRHERAPAEPDAVEETVAARVDGAEASVQRGREWSPLGTGMVQFAPGTILRVGRLTTVTLERGDERALLEAGGRFVVAPRPGVLVGTTRGTVAAGGAGATRIDVPGGTIVIAAEGRATVSVDAKETRVAVQARHVDIESGAERQTVSSGQRARVKGPGRLSVEGRGLAYADVEVRVGESVVIHDPAPPTAVRFDFAGACAGGGTIQLRGPRGEGRYGVGELAVALPLAAGRHRYELRCDSKVVERGTVNVTKDTGTRRLAPSPPATRLEADGRSYTVLYQNRLPKVELAWPKPPATAPFQLVHEHDGRTQTIPLEAPSHTFAAGKLLEGEHTFHFEGGGKVSRRTRVRIAFDNAAPTAALEGPVTLSARPGDPVTIGGHVLPGWRVSVEGQTPSKDPQGRFTAQVDMPNDRRALQVRLEHPERGTHLYLRRGARE